MKATPGFPCPAAAELRHLARPSEVVLLDGPIEWPDRTDAILMELHPNLVDCDRLRRLVGSRGFGYVPAHSRFPANMPCFTKVVQAESRKA